MENSNMGLFKTRTDCRLLRNRNTIATGPFGYSVMATCLAIITAATLLFICIWPLENAVLYHLFGMGMPLVFKIWSAGTTVILFSILCRSVTPIYLLIVSCLLYFMNHMMLLAGLVQLYMRQHAANYTLFRMMYHSPQIFHFAIFMVLSILRLILTLPLLYYVMVLASIRTFGGTGWECLSSLKLEEKQLEGQRKQLEIRSEWLNLVNQE
ncbi:hypothetical protein, conserved [Babesia bigemina]|uniref:Uncharacterized protein n=1 Tax=Babesia bigemina TaxID=5866 RepID=A0A061D8Z9_BABBI|nr:hypothetical protein, conserved [Babesia bigemina]CDR97023.1 hypothetical protein, conserved [Babesia bigemina]|eukprot:XP_012769209.1 hypothetical protein, conserved [Babesia bigemina]